MNQKNFALVMLIAMALMLSAVLVIATWPAKTTPVAAEDIPDPSRRATAPEPDLIRPEAPEQPADQIEVVKGRPEPIGFAEEMPLGGGTEPVDMGATINDLAERSGMSREDLLHTLGLPADTSTEDSIVQIADEYGLTVDDIYDALRNR